MLSRSGPAPVRTPYFLAVLDDDDAYERFVRCFRHALLGFGNGRLLIVVIVHALIFAGSVMDSVRVRSSACQYVPADGPPGLPWREGSQMPRRMRGDDALEASTRSLVPQHPMEITPSRRRR